MTEPAPPSATTWRGVAIAALAVVVALAVGLTVTLVLLLGDDETPDPTSAPSTAPTSAEPSPSLSPSPSPPSPEPAGVTDAELAPVTGVASDFLVAVNTYGPDLLAADGTMPAYRAAVTAFLTPTFAADFLQNVGVAESTVADDGVRRTAEVQGAAVSRLENGTGEALVYGSSTTTGPDAGKPPPTPFRVVVRLAQVDGTWLVDDFTALDDGAATSGVATALGAPLDAAVAEVADTVTTVLSYDYRDLDVEDYRPYLTEKYFAEFGAIFASIAESAPDLQVVVVGTPVAAGLTAVTDGTLDVVVFLDRDTTRADSEPTTFRDAVSVRVVRAADRWLIDDLSTGDG